MPFFYYVTHFWALHLLVALMAWLRYGGAAIPLLLSPVPSMGGSRDLFPPDFGYPLWVVYLVWIFIVVAIYPLCRWFAGVKARRREWWLSYFETDGGCQSPRLSDQEIRRALTLVSK